MKFGTVIWGVLVMVIIVSVAEAYDEKLAMMLALVTLFALFLANANQVTAIIRAIVPGAGIAPLPPREPT